MDKCSQKSRQLKIAEKNKMQRKKAELGTSECNSKKNTYHCYKNFGIWQIIQSVK
jgi:hypothetical protein